eukprot:COSAG02_NODE_1386_length_12941_cov_32.080128_7_plen_181_part_00
MNEPAGTTLSTSDEHVAKRARAGPARARAGSRQLVLRRCGASSGSAARVVSLLPVMPAKVTTMRKALLGTEKIGKTYKVCRALAVGPPGWDLSEFPCLRRWLHQVKDVIGLGSQATVKEGLVKKTKGKVAIKVYEVRHITFSLAPSSTLRCSESHAIRSENPRRIQRGGSAARSISDEKV